MTLIQNLDQAQLRIQDLDQGKEEDLGQFREAVLDLAQAQVRLLDRDQDQVVQLQGQGLILDRIKRQNLIRDLIQVNRSLDSSLQTNSSKRQYRNSPLVMPHPNPSILLEPTKVPHLQTVRQAVKRKDLTNSRQEPHSKVGEEQVKALVNPPSNRAQAKVRLGSNLKPSSSRLNFLENPLTSKLPNKDQDQVRLLRVNQKIKDRQKDQDQDQDQDQVQSQGNQELVK